MCGPVVAAERDKDLNREGVAMSSTDSASPARWRRRSLALAAVGALATSSLILINPGTAQAASQCGSAYVRVVQTGGPPTYNPTSNSIWSTDDPARTIGLSNRVTSLRYLSHTGDNVASGEPADFTYYNQDFGFPTKQIRTTPAGSNGVIAHEPNTFDPAYDAGSNPNGWMLIGDTQRVEYFFKSPQCPGGGWGGVLGYIRLFP
jgi:hypothetical protein